jgi:hypothetical protein
LYLISHLFSTRFVPCQARQILKFYQINHISFRSHIILLCDNKRKQYLLQSCRHSSNYHCPDADSLILFTIRKYNKITSLCPDRISASCLVLSWKHAQLSSLSLSFYQGFISTFYGAWRLKERWDENQD